MEEKLNETKKIILVTQGEVNSGINKYTMNTFSVVRSNSELYSIKFRNQQGNLKCGKTIEGIFPYGNSIFNLNSLMPSIAYKDFRNYLMDSKKRGSVIHVTSPHVIKVVPDFDNIVTIHDVSPFLPINYYNLEYILMRRLYAHYIKYDHILTVSDYVKGKLIEMGPKGEVTRIYPYVSENFFPINEKQRLRKKYGLPLDKTLLISVSTNIKRKNLKVMPEILSKLGNDYRLVRIGDEISNSYTFRPKDEMEMNEIYNSCDALISTSLDEGFGYPLVEAMKSGISVIVSDIPVHREIMGNYANYFQAFDTKEATTVIKESLTRTVQKNLEYEKWLDRYSYNRFTERMNLYYNDVLNMRGRN